MPRKGEGFCGESDGGGIHESPSSMMLEGLVAAAGAVPRAWGASGLRLHLLGGVVLEADGRDEV